MNEPPWPHPVLRSSFLDALAASTARCAPSGGRCSRAWPRSRSAPGAGFVAGLILGSITGTLELLPGLLVLIPASVGMRGMIFGAMGARLGTGIAAGVFEPTLRPGGLLARNVEVAIISAVLTSFYLAAMAKLVASAFGEDVVSFWDLVTISVVGGVLASAVILVVTIALAVAVVPARVGPRRRLDAHGHGDRRHDHAARALPGDVRRPQRLV